MSGVFVHGLGAVSPAGWGVPALRAATTNGEPLPTKPLARPGWDKLLWVRQVPPPAPKPVFFAHPRLRRANLIAQYTVGAAAEAIGTDATGVQSGSIRLGIVVCVMAGCVTYARRFCEETINDPAIASPLLFPETVFNAPASHLAAYLGATGASYTLVGDEGTFVQGLALAADWLVRDQADACIVVGAEEMDWIVADAMRHFQHGAIHSDGAGAVYLKKDVAADSIAELVSVTDSMPFTKAQSRNAAAHSMRAQLGAAHTGSPAGDSKELLCLGTQKLPRSDVAELAAWQDWNGHRLAPKDSLGEAFGAGAAWQCVLACDALQRAAFSAANVSVVGTNQQAIGARFARTDSRTAAA
jgi:hypothetical protein